MPSRQTNRLLTLLGLPSILALTLLIYWPGLSGTFLLDTVHHLKPLGQINDQDTSTSILKYVFGGSSSPLGRPLALLSFLLNDNTWPAIPFAFKYTNLLLHLINGVLVFWLIHKLLITIQHKQPLLVALVTCLIWLIHPLQISAVLYVIQRMTELSTLFTLAALISWLYGRKLIVDGNIFATCCTSIMIVLFSLLALLCKETAVLIPAYILILEILLNQKNNRTAALDRWLKYFATLPTILMITAVFYLGLSSDAWEWRPFSMLERVLTETHVLASYLTQIVIPRIGGLGIFHDDFPISTSLFSPLATFPSILLIASLILSAVLLRRKLPIYSFAIAWFFAGHFIEGTILPLELYFEHRNYLPMLGIVMAGVSSAIMLASKLRRIILLLMTIYILACALLTFSNASLWGEPLASAIVWANEKPASIRAQLTAFSAVRNYVRKDKEKKEWHYLQQAIKHNQKDPSLQLEVLLFQCRYNSIEIIQVNNTIHLLKTSKLHPADIGTLYVLATQVFNGECANSLSLLDIERLTSAAEFNPSASSPTFMHLIHYLRGEIYVHKKDLNMTMHHFDLAYKYRPEIKIRLQQTLFLISAELYSDAREILDKISQESSQLQLFIYEDDIKELMNIIELAQSNYTRNNEQ